MTDQRGLAFMDAVKELAAEAGMELPAPDPRAAQAAERATTLHDVMAAAQAWFVEQPCAAEAARRRAPISTGAAFDAQTRWSGSASAMRPTAGRRCKAALARSFPTTMLIEAGLRIVVDEQGALRPVPRPADAADRGSARADHRLRRAHPRRDSETTRPST